MGIQVGEKLSQNYTLEVTNPGGHSSRPTPDNAIYRLAAGLGKQRLYVLPQFDMVIVRFADLTSSKGRDFDNREFLAPILNLEKK